MLSSKSLSFSPALYIAVGFCFSLAAPEKAVSFVWNTQFYLTFKTYVAILTIERFSKQILTVENISSTYKKDVLG